MNENLRVEIGKPLDIGRERTRFLRLMFGTLLTVAVAVAVGASYLSM